MSYQIYMTDKALEDIRKLKASGDKPAMKKLASLLEELKEHPKSGTGRPEQLRGELSGKWSRRISEKHRLVYEINDETVIVDVLQAYGHYSDK